MNLQQWLREATAPFPPGVRERLNQEYAAHLEDSMAAGGSADPLHLFGDPAQVRKSLERSYLTTDRLKTLQGQNLKVLWWLYGLYMLSKIGLFILNPTLMHGLGLSLTAIIPVVAWTVSRSWPELRRVTFLNQFTITVMLSQILFQPGFWDSTLSQISTVFCALCLPFLVHQLHQLDRRLRNTLQHERRG